MYSERFVDALEYACRLHGRQVRKGSNVPYFSHLLSVCGLVMEHGGTEDECIAALLHDAIEDQGGDRTRREIRAKFGEVVVDIVDGCTDADVIPKPPWRERKVRYVAHVREAGRSVRLVSASDKLHNARTLLEDFRLVGAALWDRFTASREETLWYYRSLVDAYRSPLPDDSAHRPSFILLVTELSHVVEELAALSAATAPTT
ncbi:MAG: HD domain-containing protein [Armatimonadetes bacterium]|nr:HD domain-containing protein [Armatimonadota bacterium]